MTGTTVVGGAAPARPGPATTTTRPGPELGLGLVGWWLLVPITAVLLLAWIGDSGGESIRFFVTWLLAVLFPGTLLWRALAGGRSVTQDLGFGAVLGLAWQLATWAICTAIGMPLLQWAAAALLVLTFVVVPALRPNLGLRATATAPPRWWHALLVTSLILAVLRTVAALLRQLPLPPEAAVRSQDIWYQLGIAQVLTEHVPPPDPSVLGEPLIYHWFATASMASGSVMSDVDPPQVLLHQWPITMVLTLVLVSWAAGEALSERQWVAPIAGALAAVLPGGLQLASSPSVNMTGAQSVQSPTGTMAAVVLLGLVGPTVLILRRQAGPGAWAAMVLLLALAGGTKPTLLPIMLVGFFCAGTFSWLKDRRPPWRIVVLVSLAGLLLLASSFTLIGSSGGSRVQFFAAMRVQPYYQAVTGDLSLPATGGWFIQAVASGDPRMILFIATLVTWYLATETPRLLALLGWSIDPVRRDPAYWWSGGCVLAGVGITLMLSHTGYSEYYFLTAVLALGMVAVVAIGANLARRQDLLSLVVTAWVGALTASALFLYWPVKPGVHTVARALTGLVVPFAILAVVGALVILVVNRARDAAAIGLQVIVLTVAASLPAQLVSLGTALENLVSPRPAPNETSRLYLTRDEQDAMLWLHKHKKDDDVAVSNVFCLPARFRPGCPEDAYWVSALSGVRLYLGGWAYAPANLGAHYDTSFLTRPPPWPDRLKDSLNAVEKPTPALLTRLRNQVGVDWIVADLRAGPVSPLLDKLAVPAFSNRDIRIYRLK
ncbi:hypothetical protein EV138_4919 [Kribbella voronezhensis]|uniref:4-amino-4-deoxy-L-arabinose transferase-like glycosyltransferase n=1 Tax=Kribbella voronezhensis TaxID=2512212 RepID=A0A4R7TGF7_9ACTN|nr:hypothetical protein [Kribbella voronezhensis]TDU91315.1 hypothetical protein EV138_4919 [Kribbella voronezhensis]